MEILRRKNINCFSEIVVGAPGFELEPNCGRLSPQAKSRTERGTSPPRVVGAPGFEPGASCAQGRRATRLRYAPTELRHYSNVLSRFAPTSLPAPASRWPESCPDSRQASSQSPASFWHSASLVSVLRQKRSQLLQTHCPALLHPLQVRCRIFDHGNPSRFQRQQRLPAALFKRHLCQPLDDRLAFLVQRVIREHQPLRRYNLAIHPAAGILVAVGRPHHKMPRATNPHVQFAHWIGESLRPKPLRHVFRLCPRLEHQLPQRIKLPRNHHRALAKVALATILCRAHLR